MDQPSIYILPCDSLQVNDSLSVTGSPVVLPVDSLWKAGKPVTTSVSEDHLNFANTWKEEGAVSFLVLAFFIAVVIFSREIFSLFPLLIKSLFKLRNHYRLEEKLSFTTQRNITAIISAIYYPLMLTLIFGSSIQDILPVSKLEFFLLSTGVVILLWLVRMGFFRTLAWITKDRNTFRFVEKIGYNHLIISVLFTFPTILITILWPDLEFISQIKILIYCCLFIYGIFLIRSYQIIISNHYSHFFFILYLCTLELLPAALIANIILSL